MRWHDGRIEVARTISAPVDLVWDLLTETRYWNLWSPMMRIVDGPSRIGVGSTGRVRTLLGFWIPFEITHYLAQDHWEWNLSGIRGTTHRVQAGREGGTTVTFTAPIWAAPYGLVMWIELRRLDRLARQRR